MPKQIKKDTWYTTGDTAYMIVTEYQFDGGKKYAVLSQNKYGFSIPHNLHNMTLAQAKQFINFIVF